jgi:acetoacetyl-CoA synthetase
MEVPVKRLFLGRPIAEVAAAGATVDPTALEWFAAFAAERGRTARKPTI